MTYLNAHAPLKTMSVKTNSLPWYNKKLSETCKIRDKSKHVFNQTKENTDFLCYKRLKNFANFLTVKVKKNHFTKSFEKCKSSSDVWNTMNNLINFRRQNVSQITKLNNIDGKSIENKNDIACKLANEFIVSKSECDITLHRDKVLLYESEYLCNNPDYKQTKVNN